MDTDYFDRKVSDWTSAYRSSTVATGALLLLDGVFLLLVSTAWARLLSLTDGAALMALAKALLVLWLVKAVALAFVFRRLLRRADEFDELRSRQRRHEDRETTEAASRELYALPSRAALPFGVIESLFFVVLTPGLATGLFGDIALPPNAGILTGLIAIMYLVGAAGIVEPFLSFVFSAKTRRVSRDAGRLGITLGETRRSLRLRLGIAILLVGLTSYSWGSVLTEQIDFQRAVGESESRLARALIDNLAGAASRDSDVTILSDRKAVDELRASTTVTPVPGRSDLLILGGDRLLVKHVLPDGRLRVAIGPLVQSSVPLFLGLLAIFSIVIVLYSILVSWFMTRTVARPISDMTERCVRMVEKGEILELESLTVGFDDELGRLAEVFNKLTRQLALLTRSARETARGDLTVTIDAHGDLGEALDEMFRGLRNIVGEITDVAGRLLLAAGESHTLARESTEIWTHRREELSEARGFVTKLLDDSSRISASLEQLVREQTATMSTQLENIEKISYTARLLSINASLEAARAGDEGRVFALVASESRGLNASIDETVTDLRALVKEIEQGGGEMLQRSEEQRRSTQLFADRVSTLVEAIEEATRRSEKIRSVSRALRHEAEGLKSSVESFRLN